MYYVWREHDAPAKNNRERIDNISRKHSDLTSERYMI
jgi:hypothetical protein